MLRLLHLRRRNVWPSFLLDRIASRDASLAMQEINRQTPDVPPTFTAGAMNSDIPRAGAWFGKRDDFDYDIFISYRWKDGRHAARWLSRVLRTYSPPRGFSGSIEPIRIYRDVELERATPDIWEERVKPALRRSRFLLVVWTPGVLQPDDRGKPNWVIREIREFLTLPQRDNVLIVRAAGPDDTPMPPDIVERFPEPGWVDLRPTRSISDFFNRQLSPADKLTALAVPVIDIKETEIPLFNRLVDRERRRTAWWVAAVSMFLLAVMSGLAVTALMQRNMAVREAAHSSARAELIESQFIMRDAPREALRRAYPAAQKLDALGVGDEALPLLSSILNSARELPPLRPYSHYPLGDATVFARQPAPFGPANTIVLAGR
jgi:TIR domain